MIWFDVSEIKDWEGHYTGIQRVISEVGRSLSHHMDGRVAFCYLDRTTATYKKIDYSFDEVRYVSAVEKEAPEAYSPVKNIVRRYTPVRIKRIAKSIPSLNPESHNPGEVINFQAGDVLFLPGAFWIYPFEMLTQLKHNSGIKMVGIMYDLVPLVVPQYVAEGTIDAFKANLPPALDLFDEWLAISKNTKMDLLQCAKELQVDLSASSINTFSLGSDIQTKYDAKSTEIPQSLAGIPSKFGLMVSTIEARKNQNLIYQALKLAVERNIDTLPVVLVGKAGWLSDDFMYQLKHDEAIKGRLIWLERVDDAGLRYLYRKANFSIYPSFYEGWGLPVAESLSNGLPCIASATSSIPEIAGDLIDYFSPFSPDELLAHMVEYSDSSTIIAKSDRIKDYQPTTWSESGEQVATLLKRLFT